MRRWRCTYKGKPDTISKSGHVAASWFNFDRRVWQRDGYEVELVNLQIHAPGKITTYQVVLRGPEGEVVRRTGHDWIALVRQVKASAP